MLLMAESVRKQLNQPKKCPGEGEQKQSGRCNGKQTCPEGEHPVHNCILLPFTELLLSDTKQSTMVSETFPGLIVAVCWL